MLGKWKLALSIIIILFINCVIFIPAKSNHVPHTHLCDSDAHISVYVEPRSASVQSKYLYTDYAKQFKKIILTGANSKFDKFQFVDSGQARYRIQLDIIQYGEANIGVLFSLLVGGIIPTKADKLDLLYVQLFNNEGNLIKKYQFASSRRSWFHLFFFPTMFKISKLNAWDKWEELVLYAYGEVYNDLVSNFDSSSAYYLHESTSEKIAKISVP